MTNVTYGHDVNSRGEPNSDDEDFIDMRLPTPTTKYRETTVGKLLAESMDELVLQNKISADLYNKILCQFDRSILNALGQRLTARVTFKASKLSTFRFLDGCWTFILDRVEFREYNCFANVPKMKILAFDGKIPVPRPRGGSAKKKWRGEEDQQPQ